MSVTSRRVSARRVTLMLDPLEMVPPGDPFQLGSLYDIDTMLQLGGQLRECGVSPPPPPCSNTYAVLSIGLFRRPYGSVWLFMALWHRDVHSREVGYFPWDCIRPKNR